LNFHNKNNIPIIKKTSAILFITIAFIAPLFAAIRLYQKLINKYEHTPTPSHPTNNCKKLSAVTSTTMKKVKKPKKLKNLIIKGS